VKSKQKLFIYDRKEMGVLLLLGITVAVFAFTFGVHLGKQVGMTPMAQIAGNSTVATQADQTPTQQELAEQAQNAQVIAEESLNQTLHEEVTKNGIKIDKPRQMDLPKETKKKSGGVTALKSLQNLETNLRRFSLQIGSFPTETEAKSQIDSYESQGLKPFVREAEVKGIGKRFRLFVGKYDSKGEAEKAGAQFRSQHLIKSFIVARITS